MGAWIALLSLGCTPPGGSPDATLAGATGSPAATTPVEDHCDEVPAGEVSLPADDAPHPGEPIEWWYWTGHLQDDEGRWYGFEEVFFSFAIGPYTAMMSNVAVADLDAGDFRYDIAYVEGQLPPETVDGFELELEGDAAVGGDGQDLLVGVLDGKDGFELELVSAKAPVLQHGDGYHDYEGGGYTWYYSRERMDAAGTLTLDGEPRSVAGTAWFDHQWGDLISTTAEGWDWFALQLDDGSEVMLFLVRGGEGLIGGSFTDAACVTTELAPEEVEVVATGSWTSPVTGCTYPMGWEVHAAGLDLVVTPFLEDAELANDVETYWEGPAEVTGDVTGRAYVELAGYCG